VSGETRYRLDFPREFVEVLPDRCVVWLQREDLGRLANFCDALAAGLEEPEFEYRPAGRG
jgi:hypothetical protein